MRRCVLRVYSAGWAEVSPSCTHARPDGLMTRMKYGNNHVVNYTYDALERPATVTYNYSINYDESGVPYAFDYNGTIYYYITNLQGDVIAIIDSSGGIVGTYKYDAWGKLVSAAPAANSIGAINPLRYLRMHVEKEETMS